MSGSAGALVIGGGHCLLPGRGLVAADLICSGGLIAEIRPRGSARGADIDAEDCVVLPGIVDIHGDAFERQVMPRPRAMFPLDVAMLETDRQLVANGITTAYHGITISWEPGLRSAQQSQGVIEALDRLEPLLLADNRIHLRWETFALDEADTVRAVLARRKTPVLAFNDHTSPLMKVADVTAAVKRHAERAMVDTDRYLALFELALARCEDVQSAICAMAEVARRHDVPMLSHDDRTPEQRAEAKQALASDKALAKELEASRRKDEARALAADKQALAQAAARHKKLEKPVAVKKPVVANKRKATIQEPEAGVFTAVSGGPKKKTGKP